MAFQGIENRLEIGQWLEDTALLYYTMKVNDLKALYEKAGTIKTQANPIHNKPAHTIPHFESSQPLQPVQTLQTLPVETVVEAVKE